MSRQILRVSATSVSPHSSAQHNAKVSFVEAKSKAVCQLTMRRLRFGQPVCVPVRFKGGRCPTPHIRWPVRTSQILANEQQEKPYTLFHTFLSDTGTAPGGCASPTAPGSVSRPWQRPRLQRNPHRHENPVNTKPSPHCHASKSSHSETSLPRADPRICGQPSFPASAA